MHAYVLFSVIFAVLFVSAVTNINYARTVSLFAQQNMWFPAEKLTIVREYITLLTALLSYYTLHWMLGF